MYKYRGAPKDLVPHIVEPTEKGNISIMATRTNKHSTFFNLILKLPVRVLFLWEPALWNGLDSVT